MFACRLHRSLASDSERFTNCTPLIAASFFKAVFIAGFKTRCKFCNTGPAAIVAATEAIAATPADTAAVVSTSAFGTVIFTSVPGSVTLVVSGICELLSGVFIAGSRIGVGGCGRGFNSFGFCS